MLEGVIIGAIVGGFIGLISYLSSKQNQNDEQIASELSEEIKQILINAPMRPVEGIPNGAAVVGYVYKIKKQNASNAWLKVMYFNRYFPTLRNKIISLDLKVPLADMQAHSIGEGSYISMLFNEDKTPQPIFE